MARLLYELAGADPDRRFSPFCWRTRFALAHKNLAAEGMPWRFTEKDRLAFSGQGLVPVLVDGGETITDSWRIAEWLEARHPTPALFGHRGFARFINTWADTVLHPALARLIVKDIHDCLAPADQAYFRTTREARFGATLEAVQAARDADVLGFRKLFGPVRTVLTGQPWLGGESPDYADYILLGSLQWARCTSPFRLFTEDDAVFAWRARGFALFGNMAGGAVGYPVSAVAALGEPRTAP